MTHEAKLEDGRIVSVEPGRGCEARPRLDGHCWHERTGVAMGSMTRTRNYICCFCGKARVVEYEGRHPPGHGAHAVFELSQVSDTEEP